MAGMAGMAQTSGTPRKYSGRAVVLAAVAVLLGLIALAMLLFNLATRPMQRDRDPVDEALAQAATQWSQRVHPQQPVSHVALLTRYDTCATARVDYVANTPGREVRLRRQGDAWVVDAPAGRTLDSDEVRDEAACLAP